MSSEQRLVDMAREATGDPSIVVAGDFEPRGLLAKRSAGSFVGSGLGGENPLAEVTGDLAGRATADAAARATGDLPLVVVLAVGTEQVHLLTTPRGERSSSATSLVVVDSLRRRGLGVEVHPRVNVRSVVLTDAGTGHRYELEGYRMGPHHVAAVLAELTGAAEGASGPG
jgi:hypothetical protein